MGHLAEMKVVHVTISDFASALQRTVLDKPVLDETGLPDRCDFTLKWSPRQSEFIQFRGTGADIADSDQHANVLPGLFTAIQEQLGLKLQPKKRPADVLVIDDLQKPSGN